MDRQVAGQSGSPDQIIHNERDGSHGKCVSLLPAAFNRAEVDVADPDHDVLQFEWELLPEPSEFGAYAGQGEVKPEGVEDFIEASRKWSDPLQGSG